MKKLIALRGNINGPNTEEENNPEYLIKTINKGVFVEHDLWYLKNKTKEQFIDQYFRGCLVWRHYRPAPTFFKINI